MKKILATLLVISLLLPTFPLDVFAVNTQIRQEVNITDRYLYAPSGSYATSSAIAAITDTSYSNPLYYFEVVASSTSGTTGTAKLVNATSSAVVATITMTGGTTYTRYRSTQFLPNSSSTVEYKVVLGNEAFGKGIVASRIVVLQNAGAFTTTETQIEIGNDETYSANATSTLASPKYWYYDSTKWDASPTFYAEVSYQPVTTISSTTIYANSGTFTTILPGGTASTSVGLWAGGGSGGGGASNLIGGDGAAGGQFASSTILAATASHTLIVASITAGVKGANGATGADSSWDSTIVVAKGGAAGLINTASTTGNTTGCVGDICRAGGSGGKGSATYGAGGGGGAGTGNTGGSATGAGVAGTGGSSDGGVGGAKVTATNNGNAGNNYGGGGSGAFKSSGGTVTGGQGAQGRAVITNYIASTTIVLQVSDGSGDGFAGWTDVAGTYMVVNGGFSPGGRVRSSAFTPVSGRNYRLAFSKGDSRTVIGIYNAKIIVDQSSGSVIDKFYSETNQDVGTNIGAGVEVGAGQTFTSSGGTLSSAKFYLKKAGVPTGNATANIYAITGTSGVDGLPTGAALATSNTLDVSTLTTSYQLITFSFSGANQISLTNGTSYALTVEYTSGTADTIIPGADNSSPTDPGNGIFKSSSWGVAPYDYTFYVYVTTASPSLLQPQYLLAPKPFLTGTSLQNQLTSWNSSEWSTTNTYTLQAEAANNSTSVVGFYTSGGTLVGNSTISAVDNRATSTLLCMPSNGDLDTKATTNNNDVFAARILVNVGDSSSPSCGPPPASTSNSIFIFRGFTKIVGNLIIR